MLVRAVYHGTPDEQFEATQKFRKLLSIGKSSHSHVLLRFAATDRDRKPRLPAERNPPIHEVIQQGVIPKFVEFLKNFQYPKLQVSVSPGRLVIQRPYSVHVPLRTAAAAAAGPPLPRVSEAHACLP